MVRLAGFVAVIVVWQVLAGKLEQVPTPGSVVTFVIGQRDILLPTVWTSLRRLLLGLAIAVPLGCILGVAVGRWSIADRVFGYVNIAMLSMPAAIWSFLALMWFGFALKAPVTATALTAFPFVTFNIAAGVRAIPRDLLLMSETFRVSWLRRVRYVIAPATAGAFFASLRFAIINGWNAVVLSEWFGSNVGVGGQARYWYDANRMDGVAGWILLFVFVLVLLDAIILQPAYRWVFRWRTQE